MKKFDKAMHGHWSEEMTSTGVKLGIRTFKFYRKRNGIGVAHVCSSTDVQMGSEIRIETC